MCSRFVAALLLLTSALSVRAGTLKGIVLANELGGTPLSGITVRADGANRTETVGGSFTLRFPEKQPGDVVLVIVEKPGYVVVNYVQLRVVLPRNPDSEVLTLLLCKEQEREEWTRQLYRLRSTEATEQEYKRHVKELEESNQLTAAKIAELQKERDQALAAAEKAADELARLKPGETTDLYAEAMSLFLQGKVPEALNVLDEQKLLQSVEAAREKKGEAEQELNRAVQSYLLKARLLNTQFQFGEAERVYAVAVRVAPDSFDAHFAFGVFSQNLNHFDDARQEYLRSLEIARRSRDKDDLAVTLNNLGLLDRDQNRMEDARLHLEEALNMYRELVQHNPDNYLATALNNLGTVDRAQSRIEDARQHYEEALRIRRGLARDNPDTYTPYVATTLNNLGLLDQDQNRTEEARQHLEQALTMYRELTRHNPDAYLPYLAATLNDLGNVDRAQNRIEDARSRYLDALGVYKKLSERDPRRYRGNIATIEASLQELAEKTRQK